MTRLRALEQWLGKAFGRTTAPPHIVCCPECGSTDVTREPPLDNDGDRPDEWECHACGFAWV